MKKLFNLDCSLGMYNQHTQRRSPIHRAITFCKHRAEICAPTVARPKIFRTMALGSKGLFGFKCALIALLAIPAFSVSADDNASVKPLEIGVVPYISARVLIESYEPLRLYLEKALGRPVKIYSAAGFKPFFNNAVNGDYDLVISAAHFARILQKEQKYTPLVRYSGGGQALVLTALNSPLKTLKDLQGQVIAVPDKLSLTTIVSITYLRESGLQPGTDFQILEVPSFASAILAVQKNDAMAAFSASGPLKQMPQQIRDSMRPVAVAGEFFPLVFLAHPRLDESTTKLLSKELLKFGSETNEGKLFLSSTGFGTIIPATATDMRSLDRYVSETKRLLNETP